MKLFITLMFYMKYLVDVQLSIIASYFAGFVANMVADQMPGMSPMTGTPAEVKNSR